LAKINELFLEAPMTETYTNWQRKLLAENPKLLDLYPDFRRRVLWVLRDLQGKGWEPVVASAWRSEEEQLNLFRMKRSKLKYGFHNVTSKQGRPESLAADIVDRRWYWNMPILKIMKYRKDIMSSCKAHGLLSGGAWLSFGVYGDFAHVEAVGVSVGEAKIGKRPG
jgi:hypothetical protein